MAITPLPPAPDRNNPTIFSDRADAWAAALATWTSEVNALSLEFDLSIADHGSSGQKMDLVAGENVTAGTLCYLKPADGKFWKANATTKNTSVGMIALATASISGNATGKFLYCGVIRDDSWNWTVNGIIYIDTSDGTMTQTEPSLIGSVRRRIGYAYTSKIIIFYPDMNYDIYPVTTATTPNLDSDNSYSGEVWALVAGENLAFGDACYYKSDGKMWKCDADTLLTSKGLISMAVASISADATGVFLRRGFARKNSWTFTRGKELFLSATAGAMDETGASGIVRLIGYAFESNIVYFNPDTVYVVR